MNDQLLMDNYLLVLKSTVEVYVHGTLESSNADVREVLKDCLSEIIDCQARTYDEMTKFGWYKVSNVESTKVKQMLDNIQSKN